MGIEDKKHSEGIIVEDRRPVACEKHSQLFKDIASKGTNDGLSEEELNALDEALLCEDCHDAVDESLVENEKLTKKAN